MVHIVLDGADRDNLSGNDGKMNLTTVASIVPKLQRRLISLLDNHHTSSLMYQPHCKCMNKGKIAINAEFSIHNDKETI
jgi:hypothetical protein